VHLGPGQHRTDVDFGFTLATTTPITTTTVQGSIGGFLFNDANGDSGKTGDDGLPGVTVSLFNKDGEVIATSVTGTDGLYNFGNLASGDYTVKVSDALADFSQTFDPDGTLDGKFESHLGAGQRVDVDFGFAPAPTKATPTTTADPTTGWCPRKCGQVDCEYRITNALNPQGTCIHCTESVCLSFPKWSMTIMYDEEACTKCRYCIDQPGNTNRNWQTKMDRCAQYWTHRRRRRRNFASP